MPFSRLRLRWVEPRARPWSGLPQAFSFELPQHLAYGDFWIDNEESVFQCYATSEPADWTGSPETWATVLKWLDTCSSSHSDCNTLEGDSFYPTRLLDVGLDSRSPIRLVITSDIRPQGGYLTLSHRWSDYMPVKLTTSTLETMLHEIAFKHLPLAFRDAIEVTRRLGKRYLWIDCLCILQDKYNEWDWRKKAATMDMVYSNTFLNISATGAKDSSHGLFFHRDGAMEVLPTTFSWPVISESTPESKNAFLIDRGLLTRELEEAPLSKRGWVFQERWLSPRVLHFGASQIFWECRQKVLCERFPIELPGLFGEYTDFRYFKTSASDSMSDSMTPRKMIRGEMAPADVCALEPRHKMWSKIVSRYSGTRLSFVEDRAVALSGVAKVLQKAFEDRYVAGLWRSGLEYQLAWSIRRIPLATPHKSQIYVAPTWSWLSVDRHVATSELRSTDLIYVKVLDVSLTHPSDDTTGSIVDGSLKLQGRLRPLAWPSHSRGHHLVIEGQNRIWSVFLDDQAMALKLPRPNEMDEKLHRQDHCSVPDSDIFGIVIGSGPLQRFQRHLFRHDMILLHCIDVKSGVFKRFGLASLLEMISAISGHSKLSEFPREKYDSWPALQGTHANSASFPCADYDSVNDLHTIIIK